MEQCKLKLCGLSRMEDIIAVNEIKPDYIGFVFAESRRQVSCRQAELLKERLNPGILAVGVFVNASLPEILKLAEGEDCRKGHGIKKGHGIIDLIQLHGDEDESYIRSLKEYTAKPVIKAVRVENREQILEAQQLPCDYLLLDTFVKGQYGGCGIQFDWNLIPKLEKPFFLAGGIDTNTLAAAVSHHPYCIDVSSAVETDGVKSPEKMKAMADLLRKLQKGEGAKQPAFVRGGE